MLWSFIERDGCFDMFECSNCGYVITEPEGGALPKNCPNCGEEYTINS